MKIAVIIEFSTKHRSAVVEQILKDMGHDVCNLGMKDTEGEPALTYMETGLLTALALNLKAADFVVGGCGSGQGYMNAVLQFPGTACGLIFDPVESWLFSQVNAGNCISIPLNKGYGGIGGDINIRYIFEKLWCDEYGAGYPEQRAEIQKDARKKLARLSLDTHKPMEQILSVMDQDVVKNALSFPGVKEYFAAAPAGKLRDCVMGLM